MDSFIPRGGLYEASETSRLNSPLDRSAPRHSWKNDVQSARRGRGLTNQISQLRSQLARERYQQRLTSEGMFPFKIYNFPKNMRRFQNDNDWRRIKVRGNGTLSFNIWPSQGILDRGTDETIEPWSDVFLSVNEQLPSDASTVTASWHEVVVPDGGPYAVIYQSVLPITGQLGIVNNDSTIGICLEVAANNTIILLSGETFDNSLNPTDSPYRKTLGVVYAVNGVLTIRQLSDHVSDVAEPSAFFTGGGGDWSNPTVFGPYPYLTTERRTRMRGKYHSSLPYYYGDIVYDDREETNALGDSGTYTYRYLSIYIANDDDTSAYSPFTLLGPMINVAPSTHSPDPWFTLSRSKIA